MESSEEDASFQNSVGDHATSDTCGALSALGFKVYGLGRCQAPRRERFFIQNLLVQIHRVRVWGLMGFLYSD